MTSSRATLTLAILALSSTASWAHVGDHAGEGVMHLLAEHGYLAVIAALAGIGIWLSVRRASR